jgi:putative aldouronate transport system substrate-binding protein
MKSIRKKVTVALGIVMMLSSLSGCKKDSTDTGANSNESNKPKKDLKLTWYIRGAGSNDSEGLKELQRKTGVTIEFQEVDTSVADEQFKLMIASGAYPDIIQWKLATDTSQVSKYYREGVYIKLNELIDKHTPNLKKILDATPEIKKQITSDEGDIAFFPSINPLKTSADKELVANAGFGMRKDWLDKLGLKVPTTIDEWYTVLKAFKDKDPNGDGSANDLAWDGTGINMFVPAWGIRNTFYRNPKTDKVAYGLLEPEFKDYLTTMNRWYSEGLLPRTAIYTDSKATDTNINSGIVGSFKALDNMWERYLPEIQKVNPNASLISVPWPKGPAGKAYTDRTELNSYVSPETTSITSTCKYPEEAAEVIDFFYSQEGNDLLNWGIQGKSYTVENGVKKFIPEVLASKEPGTGLGSFARYYVNYPKCGTNGAEISRLSPEKTEGHKIWANADTSLILPAALSFTGDESAKINEINTDMAKYTADMTNKFVTGEEPLSNYDNFVQTLKKMRIEEALKIYQAAYDRYKARK